MPRRREDDRLEEWPYGVIARMVVLLRAGSPQDAEEIGQRALKGRKERALDAWARRDDETPATGETRTAPRKKTQARLRLFEVARPENILAAANVVQVYLRDHPMWADWDWPATHEVNARMLPFVQRLDPADQLPHDPRLALPFTSAGLTLLRALHGEPADDIRETTMDVYAEIREGLVRLDQLLLDVTRQKLNDDLPDTVFGDFTHITMAAETLLLHAVRLGPEAWTLILRCPLGAHCRDEQPYYVAEPREGADGHSRCREATH